MFIDRARIRLTAGAGGKGCCSFRREKYVSHGGPNGGDGGDGGNISIQVDDRLSSLLDVHFHSHWKGNRGVHGQGSDCHGKKGEDIFIKVPPGTVIRDWESKEVLSDLTDPDACFLAVSGGKGGRGNARFTTSTDRAPRFAELGEPGQFAEFSLELKVIADVGLVGLPNAGKSTLLSRVSAARPKIADYPFTTLSPNLGVVNLGDYRTLTIADIPGIIEGAADGKGLGHDFLRHIERTKVLVFLIDAGDESPAETLEVLENELAQHSAVFATRSKHIVFNKADVTENREHFAEVSKTIEGASFISAVTGEGVDALLETLWESVDRVRKEEAGIEIPVAPEAEYVYEAPYSVEEAEGGFVVTGKAIDRTVMMTDFTNDDAVRHMQKTLDKMGLFKALKRLGAKEGQSIVVGGVELEYRSD